MLLIIRNIEKFSRKYREVETGQAYMGVGLIRPRVNDEEGEVLMQRLHLFERGI